MGTVYRATHLSLDRVVAVKIINPEFATNADISHLHLSNASFEDVAKLKGLIGHIHLSDCDGKVHGDLPAGHGVTPIKEYLQAIIEASSIAALEAAGEALADYL